MKTYIYLSFSGPRGGRRIESGRTHNNCDAVSAIGRPHRKDEVVGAGRNYYEALEDALDEVDRQQL